MTSFSVFFLFFVLKKVGKTQAKGIRLKEATSINKSLTTLGTCMNKLADNMSGSSGSLRHIPFRESVLTRLLSDSLGGNCKTTLVINASPCSYNVEETISTLRFGERAKKIKTKARINQIKTPQQYRKELQAAQTEIMKLYRIIEDCAFDINNAFKGTLNVENCKSYKKLLDLKKYTLNIINGKTDDDIGGHSNVSNSLLANILPDLTNLQGLKKVHTVKKQQKKTGVLNVNGNNLSQQPMALQMQASFRRQASAERIYQSQSNNNPQSPSQSKSVSYSANSSPIKPQQSQTKNDPQSTASPKFDPKNRLRRGRYGSFEELDVDNPITLVRNNRNKNAKKVDPLKRKNSKQDFKVSGNNSNAAFKPPEFDYAKMFNVGGEDGLTLGQMGGGFNMDGNDYNSNMESEFSDYNSEYDNLGIMSPAPNETMSDASASNIDYGAFRYNSDTTSAAENMVGFDDFQEEELPKNFFEMDEDQREAWAKQKNLDPLLVDYRFQISREIDWEHWNSDDEGNAESKEEKDKEIEDMSRVELENEVELKKQKLLMLCRLLRTKSQEFGSRVDIEMSKYDRLASQYRAKNEENSQLMHENRNLEKEYEVVCNEKRELQKSARKLKLDLEDTKKKLSKLEKQLKLRMNELNIERQTQNKMSNNKTSMLRKKVHEKYAEKYKKIENDIIKNNTRDLDLRFTELAKAFKSQAAKYQDLEEVIENSKQQMQKYEELMRQKDQEEEILRKEIENEDIRRKELMLQHNLEVKQIREQMKKTKNKADMWKRRAFVYKNAVNSLMEEAEFNNIDDSEQEQENFEFKKELQENRQREYKNDESDNPPSFNIDILSHAKLKPLNSFSPRAQLGLVEIEKANAGRDNKYGDHLSPGSASGGSGGSKGKRKKMSVKSPRFERHSHRKSRGSIGGMEDLFLETQQQKLRQRQQMTVNRGRDKISGRSGYNRAMSPIRNEPFHMTPSQKAALTSVKMKIRGGGGSDEDVYRTPIKTSDTPPRRIRGNATGSLRSRNNTPNTSPNRLQAKHNRNVSQPLTQSLPRPTGYSSDEYGGNITPTIPSIATVRNIKNQKSPIKRKSASGYSDKSRNAVPIAVGIDQLIRNKSIEGDDYMFDASPSPYLMQNIGSIKQSKSGSSSPRGSVTKKGPSPLPPPPRSVKQRTSRDADYDDSDDEGFEDDLVQHGNDPEHFLSPKSHTSPAGSFFSKIKHTANNDEEDDFKTTSIHKSPRRKPMSMPEPGQDSSDDEGSFGGRYSDTSNFTDDNPPSYRQIPSASSSVTSIKSNKPYASGKISRTTNAFAHQRHKRRAVDGTLD